MGPRCGRAFKRFKRARGNAKRRTRPAISVIYTESKYRYRVIRSTSVTTIACSASSNLEIAIGSTHFGYLALYEENFIFSPPSCTPARSSARDFRTGFVSSVLSIAEARKQSGRVDLDRERERERRKEILNLSNENTGDSLVALRIARHFRSLPSSYPSLGRSTPLLEHKQSVRIANQASTSCDGTRTRFHVEQRFSSGR